MKKVLIVLISAICISISGCSTKNTIGNGKADPVEAAVIKVAVGAALNANPGLIIPVSMVSSDIYKMLSTETVEVSLLREVVELKITSLGVDKYTKESMLELCDLLEAEIKTQIGVNVDSNNKLIVVKDVIKIVMDVSTQRLK